MDADTFLSIEGGGTANPGSDQAKAESSGMLEISVPEFCLNAAI